MNFRCNASKKKKKKLVSLPDSPYSWGLTSWKLWERLERRKGGAERKRKKNAVNLLSRGNMMVTRRKHFKQGCGVFQLSRKLKVYRQSQLLRPWSFFLLRVHLRVILFYLVHNVGTLMVKRFTKSRAAPLLSDTLLTFTQNYPSNLIVKHQPCNKKHLTELVWPTGSTSAWWSTEVMQFESSYTTK